MIEWIVTSSILIAVIIALRYLLKGKISLRIQYALWGLVLLRLLIPFSIGGSRLSVMNTAEKIPVVQDAKSISNVDQIEHMSNGSVEGYYPSDFMCDFPKVVAESKTAGEYARMEQVLSFREAFIPIWLCGTAVLFIMFAASNGRFSSRLRRTRRPLEVRGSALPIYITGETDTPCLFGLFRPAIYVTPEAAEDATILRHTVEHETTHFRHGDNFWSVLRGICLAVHWYNPLVWWAAFLSRRDAELACDEATINRLGERERAGYGRTLISMTCQKRTALLITATTMTGSKSSIRERIMLLARKPKMKIYTLITVVLAAAVAAGCTFTGAKEEQENFSPDTVSMVQMLSSAFPPAPITDAETVEYLWSVYQGFDFDGTAETLDKENVWSISVAFSNSESGESERFTIFQGGLCQLGDDYETYHILLDGAEIYNEFLSCFEAAKKADSSAQSGVNISADDLSDVPAAVIAYAKDYIAKQIDDYHSVWPEIAPGCSVTAAKITGLTQMNTGTAGLNTSVNLYSLEYRLLVSGNIDSVLVGGMSYKEIDGENWLTEWSSGGQPYLLLYCDDSGTKPVWDRICETNTEEIYQYNTSEMLEQYGNFYTAAAMELYHKCSETKVVPLSSEQIAQVNEAFTPTLTGSKGNLTVNPISCFFTSYYDYPEDINLAEFLRYFPNGSSVTDETEFNALKELDNWPFGQDATLESMPVPVSKYTSEALDQALWEYAGITRDDLNGVGSDDVLYLEEYDAYYNFTSDFGPGVFNCARGEVQGSTVRLYAEYGDGSGAVLTLRKQDGRYLILSHQKTGG